MKNVNVSVGTLEIYIRRKLGGVVVKGMCPEQANQTITTQSKRRQTMYKISRKSTGKVQRRRLRRAHREEEDKFTGETLCGDTGETLERNEKEGKQQRKEM